MPRREQRQRVEAFVWALKKEHGICDVCKQAFPPELLEYDVQPSVKQMIQLSYGAKRINSVLEGRKLRCLNCRALALAKEGQ